MCVDWNGCIEYRVANGCIEYRVTWFRHGSLSILKTTLANKFDQRSRFFRLRFKKLEFNVMLCHQLQGHVEGFRHAQVHPSDNDWGPWHLMSCNSLLNILTQRADSQAESAFTQIDKYIPSRLPDRSNLFSARTGCWWKGASSEGRPDTIQPLHEVLSGRLWWLNAPQANESL